MMTRERKLAVARAIVKHMRNAHDMMEKYQEDLNIDPALIEEFFDGCGEIQMNIAVVNGLEDEEL